MSVQSNVRVDVRTESSSSAHDLITSCRWAFRQLQIRKMLGMIHMLSRFDLKSGVNFEDFSRDYHNTVAQLQAKGLVESTGKIGRRERDTSMDTDAEEAQEFYAIMSFKDREQLDRSYALLTDTAENQSTSHPAVMRAVKNAVFTCWRDME